MSKETGDIKILQENLSSIRKIAGWTTQDLGEKIGVTKQTVSNLENQKTEMTLTQYIAIRTVLDYEAENNKTNEILPQALQLLLDNTEEKVSEEDYQKMRQAVATLAAACAGGASIAGLVPFSNGIYMACMGATIGTPKKNSKNRLDTKPWLKKILD